jgi:hypothetical protein
LNIEGKYLGQAENTFGAEFMLTWSDTSLDKRR